MRNIQIAGLSLVAVALSAFAASSAFALESTWLVGGVKPTTQVATDSIGELLLEDTKGGPFGEKSAVLCTGTDEGFVGPGPADETTKVTVTKCVVVTLCENSPEVKAEALNLPWNTKIELIGAVFYDDITAKVGEVSYKTSCTLFGITVEDACKLALARVLVINAGNNVEIEALDTDADQPSANCSRGGAGTGKIDTDTLANNLVLTVSGASLAVSEG
jgi:hypothetical protein